MVEETIQKESLSEIETYFDRLWPILRSISGEGVRQTHDILAELVELERFEIPSGTPVFDWLIPKEWLVNEAYVIDPTGKRILDVKENNLHLLNYSSAFKATLSRDELDKHLHSLPKQAKAIPYLTTYYQERWGFCLSQEQRDKLPQGNYRVVIDTEHKEGSLTLSEALLKGSSQDEVLISTYTCHPSMANNELSGPLVAAFLYKRLAQQKNRRLSYRFVFLPETIGAIAYLKQQGDHLKKHTKAGFVITCAGNNAPFTYKCSRQGNSLTDRVAKQALKNHEHSILPFSPLGSDERQYCSPAFNLPIGSLMRSMYSRYPEYHTSLDNKNFISFKALQESIDMYETMLLSLEQNQTYLNLYPYGEPRLDKHGLYDSLGHSSVPNFTQHVLWLLNYSDGQHDLLDIAEKSGFSVSDLAKAAKACLKAKLIQPS